MLKLIESRLSQEKETVLSQQQSQNLLLTNLQAIQVIYEFGLSRLLSCTKNDTVLQVLC